jgi:DNA (cytosine-5)-methyltransferase 1
MEACSLFSGCGGDTLGMENAGLSVTYYSELKKVFQDSHSANFTDSKLLGGDIVKVTDDTLSKLKGKITVLFGGFPCQSFSQGGKKDPSDPRGQMYLQLVRATRLIEPDYVIGENVKGLLSRVTPNGEKFLDVILKAFADIGYQCHFKVMKVQDHGVPQTRERLIIIGKKGEWTPSWPKPLGIKKTLRGILRFDMEGAYEVPKELFEEAGVPHRAILMGEGVPIGEPHPYVIDRSNVREVNYREKNYGTYALSFGKRKSPVHAEILDPDGLSKTIICTYGHQPRLFVALGVGDRRYLRCLSVDEIKEIQGFPRGYQLAGSKKDQIVQLGNAVPPPLIERVCRELLVTS